eukprot:TRINITY_DN3964_c0_g2_i8.p1 TRINITY_DN3964_c0_g2~~TRINITY_DN3964_c0_g2_i8.p1  ORF type:complete len:156 (-),score=28.84 TRINITY_DN3964_c0_g2_i8:141-608(-)
MGLPLVIQVECNLQLFCCTEIPSWQGQQDCPLNEEGREQAAALARKLKEEHRRSPFDLLVSSPLSRAYDTASMIGSHLGLVVITDPRLMEISLGQLEGHKIENAIPGSWSPTQKMGVTGESFQDVQERMTDVIHYFSHQNPGKKIIIVKFFCFFH